MREGEVLSYIGIEVIVRAATARWQHVVELVVTSQKPRNKRPRLEKNYKNARKWCRIERKTFRTDVGEPYNKCHFGRKQLHRDKSAGSEARLTSTNQDIAQQETVIVQSKGKSG